jgi:hypothetical protein
MVQGCRAARYDETLAGQNMAFSVMFCSLAHSLPQKIVWQPLMFNTFRKHASEKLMYLIAIFYSW